MITVNLDTDTTRTGSGRVGLDFFGPDLSSTTRVPQEMNFLYRNLERWFWQNLLFTYAYVINRRENNLDQTWKMDHHNFFSQLPLRASVHNTSQQAQFFVGFGLFIRFVNNKKHIELYHLYLKEQQ